MTIEVILLALASTIRPTSLAATYALLASAAPRRLMTAYVLAGLAFTVLFGLVVVLAIGGIDIGAGSSRTKAEAEVVAGVVALVLAWLVRTGRFNIGGPPGDLPRPKGRWDRLLEERLTFRTALLAGPATHIPGIFYLLALNLIVTHERGRGGALLEVALYNVIWFALPLAALVICVVDPGIARNAIGSVNGWARRHAQRLSIAILAAMGAVLLVGGIAGLAG